MLFFCLYKYFTLFPNRQLLGEPCSLWIDNFSKTLHRTNPTLSRDVYSSMLWTGMAVFASEKTSQLDASVQTDDHGAVIPAMPAQICQHRDQVLEGLSYVHNQGRHYLTNSLVHRFGVNNIPMAILDPEDVMQNQHPSKDHSMDIVHPYQMVDMNIGSNIGLVSILRQHFYDPTGMDQDECKKYVCLNADENIFWRTLKVFRFISLDRVMSCHCLTDYFLCAGDVRSLRCGTTVAKVHGCFIGLVAQLQMGHQKDHAGFWQGYHCSYVPPLVSGSRVCSREDEVAGPSKLPHLHSSCLPIIPSTAQQFPLSKRSDNKTATRFAESFGLV